MNLTETAAEGGAIPIVLEALQRTDADRRAVAGELAALSSGDSVTALPDPQTLRGLLRRYVDEWHALLSGNVNEARRFFDIVLRERIVFRPIAGPENTPSYELTVPIAFDRLLVRVVPGLAQVGDGVPNGLKTIPRITICCTRQREATRRLRRFDRWRLGSAGRTSGFRTRLPPSPIMRRLRRWP